MIKKLTRPAPKTTPELALALNAKNILFLENDRLRLSEDKHHYGECGIDPANHVHPGRVDAKGVHLAKKLEVSVLYQSVDLCVH
jgi:hypothetical protein